ncbi:Alpha-catulin [Halotydeus destructor]|nr:Alpha-catulin [Halotydeus destructor]
MRNQHHHQAHHRSSVTPVHLNAAHHQYHHHHHHHSSQTTRSTPTPVQCYSNYQEQHIHPHAHNLHHVHDAENIPELPEAIHSVSDDDYCGQIENRETCHTAHNAIKTYEELLKMGRMTLCGQVFRERLSCAFGSSLEKTQDFTDSAYTGHEHREKLLFICDRARRELNQLLTIALSIEQEGSSTPTEEFENALAQTVRATTELKHQLQITALDQADELFKLTEEIDILTKLKASALEGDRKNVDECTEHFSEHAERVQEVCRLLHHVSSNETLQLASRNRENCVCIYGSQLLNACQRLCLHPSSKSNRENLDVFLDLWLTLIADIQQLSRDISELLIDRNTCFQAFPSSRSQTKHVTIREECPGPVYPTAYARPHEPMISRPSSALSRGHTSVPYHSKVVDDEEEELVPLPPIQAPNRSLESAVPVTSGHQAVAPPLGVGADGVEADAKSQTDAEDNDIVRRAKAMSTMAISMYQFTRGQGELKTTQDLFTQAEFFAEEANKFYKEVRPYTYQVPSGELKKELLEHLAKVPAFVQQLQFSVKNSTVGKAATFSKVDTVLHGIKDLMTCVSKTVESCMTCSQTYKIEMVSRARSLSAGRYDGDDYDESGMASRGASSSSDPNIVGRKGAKAAAASSGDPRRTRVSFLLF